MDTELFVHGHTESGSSAQGAQSSRLLDVLRCPDCGDGRLERAGDALRCGSCGELHPLVEGVPVLFPASMRGERTIAARRKKPAAPGKEKAARGAAYRWREYRIEELLPPADSAPDVLLLGCGDGGEIPFLEQRGFAAIGFDILRSDSTSFLADAHRIPVADECFDIVISMQVLEHLHSPWIAVDEVARVLRPGGWFIGSVAFLKPYHRSYFHMTHEGVTLLLERSGLVPDRLAGAQSLTYSLYGGFVPLLSRPVKRAVLGAFDRLVASARARFWSMTRRMDADLPTDRYRQPIPMSFRQLDRLRHAPAVVFRARKATQGPPGEAHPG